MSILSKAGLESKVLNFFANYLVQRKTNYIWNNMQSPDFEVNIGIGQGSALSPILSALYLTLFLYILEKCLKLFCLWTPSSFVAIMFFLIFSQISV